jgi:hypothetical protein
LHKLFYGIDARSEAREMKKDTEKKESSELPNSGFLVFARLPALTYS